MTKKAKLQHLERTKIVDLATNLSILHMLGKKCSETGFEGKFIIHSNTMSYEFRETPKKWANRECERNICGLTGIG